MQTSQAVPKQTGQRIALLAIGLLLVGLPLLLLLALWLFPNRSDGAANRYAPQRLSQLDDDLLRERLGELREMGDQGVAYLVPLLGDRRQAVADSAYNALTARMDRWQMQSESRHWKSAKSLADRLARQSPQFPREGQRRAAELATRLLREAAASRSGGTADLVESCEQVLKSGTFAASLDRPHRTTRSTAAIDGSSASLAEQRDARDAGSDLAGLPEEVTRLPRLPVLAVPQVDRPSGRPSAGDPIAWQPPSTLPPFHANSEVTSEPDARGAGGVEAGGANESQTPHDTAGDAPGATRLRPEGIPAFRR